MNSSFTNNNLSSSSLTGVRVQTASQLLNKSKNHDGTKKNTLKMGTKQIDGKTHYMEIAFCVVAY